MHANVNLIQIGLGIVAQEATRDEIVTRLFVYTKASFSLCHCKCGFLVSQLCSDSIQYIYSEEPPNCHKELRESKD